MLHYTAKLNGNNIDFYSGDYIFASFTQSTNFGLDQLEKIYDHLVNMSDGRISVSDRETLIEVIVFNGDVIFNTSVRDHKSSLKLPINDSLVQVYSHIVNMFVNFLLTENDYVMGEDLEDLGGTGYISDIDLDIE